MAENIPFDTDVTINDLLEAGLHFGHQTKRWNPKMKPFIFGKRNEIYIIDLNKTLIRLKLALQFLYDTVSQGKCVIFVCTKRLSQKIVEEAASRCGQYYMVNRWLGAILTNHKNIKSSIKHMKEIEELEEKGALARMPQKEASRLRHELARLQRNLRGLKDISELPGALIVIDVNREANAVREANRMNIPVIGVVDTNSDPDAIDYPIPGNDDAMRSIKFIVDLFADTISKASERYTKSVTAETKKKEAEEEKKKREIKTANKPTETKEADKEVTKEKKTKDHIAIGRKSKTAKPEQETKKELASAENS